VNGHLPPGWATSTAVARQRLQAVPTADAAKDRLVRTGVVAVVVLVLAAVFAVVAAFGAPSGSTAAPAIPERVLLQPVVAGEPANGGAAPQARGGGPARMGAWTPQVGREIAQRALRWLNWPYSFAGGNAAGPTFGVAVDKDSRNDPNIRGFDCSGLVLYALAPWRQLTHFAASQYVESGTWHPSLESLQPGDLVFWSKDGTIAGVGHVAIYVGDGKVVQAPHSGARITITPLGEVEPGAIGTVRPLT
jgi:cell wall-associated NlpC family hydrolase